MKKLFIGCGIVVLLIVGFVGYITYQMYPDVKEWQSQWTGAFERLQTLERERPFDAAAQTQLDGQRFASVLDIRVSLSDTLEGIEERMRSLATAKRDGEDIGFLDMFRDMFRTAAPLLPEFASRLEQSQMSWPEFAWYTRLMWACLYRVDAGVGPPELEPLRGSYDRLVKIYEQLQREGNNLAPLSEVIGKFPQPLVSEASLVLAQDVERVERGLRIVGTEHLYMQPVSRLEDLQSLQVPDPPRAPSAPMTPLTLEPVTAQPIAPLGKAEPDAAPALPAPEPDKPGDK